MTDRIATILNATKALNLNASNGVVLTPRRIAELEEREYFEGNHIGRSRWMFNDTPIVTPAELEKFLPCDVIVSGDYATSTIPIDNVFVLEVLADSPETLVTIRMDIVMASRPDNEMIRSHELAQALKFTVEYVGSGLLRAEPGWAWYDALSTEPWFDEWLRLVSPFKEKEEYEHE